MSIAGPSYGIKMCLQRAYPFRHVRTGIILYYHKTVSVYYNNSYILGISIVQRD